MENEEKITNEKKLINCFKEINNAICDILSIKDECKRKQFLKRAKDIMCTICTLMDVDYVDRPTINGKRKTLTMNKNALAILERDGKLIEKRVDELFEKLEIIRDELKWLASDQKQRMQNEMFYPIFNTCDGLVIFVYLATKTDRKGHKGVLTVETFDYIAKKIIHLRNGCFICDSKGFDLQNSARIIRWFEGDTSNSENSENGIIENVLSSGVSDIQTEIKNAFDKKLETECEDSIAVFTADKSTRSFPKKEVAEAFFKNTGIDFYTVSKRKRCHDYLMLKGRAGDILGSEYDKISTDSDEHVFAQSEKNNHKKFKELKKEELFEKIKSSKNCAGLLYYIPHELNNWLGNKDIFKKIEMIKEAASDDNPYKAFDGKEDKKDREKIISAAKQFKASPFSSYILSLDEKNFPEDMPEQACNAMWEIVKDEFDY